MKSKKECIPFFAKFLEGMDPEKLPRVKGGAVTDKYPSDNDELERVTNKYPSDDDEVNPLY